MGVENEKPAGNRVHATSITAACILYLGIIVCDSLRKIEKRKKRKKANKVGLADIFKNINQGDQYFGDISSVIANTGTYWPYKPVSTINR